MSENCIREKIPLSSTELMSIKNILRENPALSERAQTDIIKTPLSADIREDKLSEGMVMKVAYPIMDRNTHLLLGVLVGGVLMNKDNEIVDKIKETVYHDEKYKGQEMGVATIFQGGVRISTNVMTKDNKRAIGTILSKEVYDRVIKEGKDWVGRAFVVKDWYITTYTPIFNMDKKLIGVLYTGILEAKYRDIQMGNDLDKSGDNNSGNDYSVYHFPLFGQHHYQENTHTQEGYGSNCLRQSGLQTVTR